MKVTALDPAALLLKLEEQSRQLVEMAEKIAVLEQDKATLLQRLQYFLSRTFARSSERIEEGQLRLFAPAPDPAPVPAPTEEITYTRTKAAGHGRSVFSDDLPRRVIEIDPPEAERVCGCCGKALQRCKNTITERGELIPAKIVVNQYVRGLWVCADGCCAPKQADLPPTVIDKGKWEASAYAHLIVAKYGDHLPLHRQVGIFRRYGIDFPKSTMCDMEKRSADLFEPVWKQMAVEIRRAPVICADETPLVFMGEKRGNGSHSRTGYVWVYRAGEKVVFDFTTSRSRAGPMAFLGGWIGVLVTDEYNGYECVSLANGIVRAYCIVHGRRRFLAALESDPIRAGLALFWINRLFWIERAIDARLAGKGKGADPLALRLAVRQRRSRVIMAKLRTQLLAWKDDPRILPKSPLGKAIRYFVRTPEQWQRFCVFVDNPEVPLHNNGSEQMIRPIALGRNNWMKAGSEKGAKASLLLASLIASCRAIGVNPEEYLSDVLRSLDRETKPENLTPWAWKARRDAAAHEPPPSPAAS